MGSGDEVEPNQHALEQVIVLLQRRRTQLYSASRRSACEPETCGPRAGMARNAAGVAMRCNESFHAARAARADGAWADPRVATAKSRIVVIQREGDGWRGPGDLQPSRADVVSERIMRSPGALQPRSAMPLLLAAMLGGCFPTFQAARIDPGFHLDAGAVAVHDQVRDSQPQGPDYLGYVAPSFGFHDRLEFGIPVGIYLQNGFEPASEHGLSGSQFVLMPYLKSALLAPGRDHLALSVQTAWIAPANVGLEYGRDMGSWEPQVSGTVIFSGGPAGDDPLVPRYQESGQFTLALAIGATWKVAGRPAVEIGLLRNHYREGAVFGDFGQPTTPRTLYDVFVGMKIGVIGR